MAKDRWVGRVFISRKGGLGGGLGGGLDASDPGETPGNAGEH
jgi:hypothetical protein